MKYTKTKMVQLLTGISAHLAEHTAQFPGLALAVIALGEAAKNPGVSTATKAATKTKTQPITISYSGKFLLVRTPWGTAGKALAHAFKVIVGRRSKSINPETGEPYFLTVFDKKTKSHKIPVEKKDEVLKAIAESGLPCVSRF